MNIYARFFDRDTLVYSVDELVQFLSDIPEINITDELVGDIRAYVEGDMPYPKRYKIRPRVYFILIKTTAQTMEEFKANRKNAVPQPPVQEVEAPSRKELKISLLAEQHRGWYRGFILFKRVILIPGTGKFQYQDTEFEAFVMAQSGQDCYNRIVAHLKNRPEVDMRSQFPSARGANFEFEYLGETLQPAAPAGSPTLPEETAAEENAAADAYLKRIPAGEVPAPEAFEDEAGAE